MRVPMSGLRQQHRALEATLVPRVLALAEAQAFVLGEPVATFERTLARLVGTAAAAGVASGTDALALSLRALGVGARADDAVIVPAFGFVASAEAVVLAGARPIFADVRGFLLDPESAREAAAGQRVRAILPVHLFGECAELDPLLGLARADGAVVVEDAAQAILATDRGRLAGSVGAAGALSFFPSKNLGGWGDGGAVVGPSEVVAAVLRLRAHGLVDGVAERVGANSRLDALQAVVLEVKATHLEAWTVAREAVAARYRAGLAHLAPRLRLPPLPRPGCRHVHNQFVVRVADPDALARTLASRGVESRRYYARPLPEHPAYARFAEGRRFPAAEDAARSALGLPIYPELTLTQQDEAIAAVEAHLA